MNTEREITQHPAKWLHIGLWIVQGLLALTFVGTGLWKLTTPIPKLAAKMPWMGQVAPGFFYVTAVIDLLGGFGVLSPAITRIKPRLTVLAALGCAAFQTGAIVFHVKRREAANTPFNFLLVALSLFVAWGRRSKAPIAPHHARYSIAKLQQSIPERVADKIPGLKRRNCGVAFSNAPAVE